MNLSQANPQNDPELTALIDAVLSEQADDAQFAELERRLSTDPAARDIYATYMNVDCELRSRFAVEGDIVGLEVELERELRDGELADFRRSLATEYLANKPRSLHFMPPRALVAVFTFIAIAIGVWQRFNSQHALVTPALAHVRDLEGKVSIIRSTKTQAAQIGGTLLPGDRLRTEEKESRAVLEYVDGTTVEVNFDSAVQFPSDGGVRLRLLSGSIDVNAAPQPADHPLIIATDHARYVVLGTRFRLYRNEEATRLELSEGKVRLEREEQNRIVETVEVDAGSAAIASADSVPVEIVPLSAGRAHLHKRLSATGQDIILSSVGDLVILNDNGRGLVIRRSEDFAVQFAYPRDAGQSYGLALASDGQAVVRLSQDHVLLWKFRELQGQALKLALPHRLVRSRALSPDGRLVAESSDEGIELFALDVSGGKLKPLIVLPNLKGKTGKAWCLAFSQDGSRLVAGFFDGTLRVYGLDVEGIKDASHRVITEFKLTGTILPLAISGDGRHLAAFTRASGLQLIDTVSGKQHSLWSSTGARIDSLKFTPDGGSLMAGCSDRTVRLWSVSDRRPLLALDSDRTVSGIAWLPMQRQLITADGGVTVWTIEFLVNVDSPPGF